MKIAAQVLLMLTRAFLAGLMMAVLLAGIFCFYYVLYRLVKLLRLLREPPEERRRLRSEKQAVRAHPFSKVSGRGRTAYLILCLESALLHFGQDAGDWRWVLERLWALTREETLEFKQIFAVCALSPVNILPYERAEALETAFQPEDLSDFWDGKPGITEEEFQQLRALYIQMGWRLCVLDPLLQAVSKTAAIYLPGSIAGWEAASLDLLQQAESILQGWEIPEPDGQTLDFLRKQTGTGWGKAFDGARLSEILGEEK